MRMQMPERLKLGLILRKLSLDVMGRVGLG